MAVLLFRSESASSLDAVRLPGIGNTRLFRLFKPGQILFAISIAALGVLNLILARPGDAVMPIIPWLPAKHFLGYLVGILLLEVGICIALGWKTRWAAILLAVLLFVCDVVFEKPKVVVKPMDIDFRTLVFEVFILFASALMLAGVLPGEDRFFWIWAGADGFLIMVGRVFFAISAVIFGISHFVIPEFIASLTSPWISGPGRFCAYFKGGAFVEAEWSSALIALGICGGSWIAAGALS